MDPKVRPTHSKPMTPSTNSSGSTVSGKLKKRFYLLLGRLGCLTLRDSWVLAPTPGSQKERRNWSRWTNRTVHRTAVWTPVRSAWNVSGWSRQTCPVQTAGQRRAADRGLHPCRTCSGVTFHTRTVWRGTLKYFCARAHVSLVSVPCPSYCNCQLLCQLESAATLPLLLCLISVWMSGEGLDKLLLSCPTGFFMTERMSKLLFCVDCVDKSFCPMRSVTPRLSSRRPGIEIELFRVLRRHSNRNQESPALEVNSGSMLFSQKA